ncbi:GroES-like protein [Thozetella sp. PMI_491]|nr:GroES-like protein [Thozetella sp. PMI_491]
MYTPTVNRAAVLEALATDVVIKERDVPTPGPGELLIKNHAIAINPVDWKRQAWGYAVSSYPVVLGSDISGVIVSVGPSVTGFAEGDRIIAFAHAFVSGDNSHGAYQNYTIVRAIQVTKLPSSMGFEEGAVLPLAAATSTMSLVHVLGLPRPTLEEPTSSSNTSATILIWGGASSCGSLAIQLARLAGLTIFTTASKQHHDYLRSLGAAVVVDYHSPTAVKDLVTAAEQSGRPIAYALDTVASADTIAATLDVLEQSKGTEEPKFASLLPAPEDLVTSSAINPIFVPAELILTDKQDLCAWLFNDLLTNGLERKAIVPTPKVRIAGYGIESLQQAMNTLKDGVSGEKLVVKLE